jgi:hypothetical protein
MIAMRLAICCTSPTRDSSALRIGIAPTRGLFIDEPMEVTYRREFRLRKYRDLLIDLFHVLPSGHDRYGVLEARDHGQLDEALAHMKDDEIYEHFADFIWRLRHGHWGHCHVNIGRPA